MSESNMRCKVVNALRSLHAIAVENPVLPGTPDINYIEGWIELKWLRSWPVRSNTPVRVERFSSEQRIWHTKRRIKGGTSWFLLQVKREWILLDGGVAAVVVDYSTKEELLSLAVRHWKNGLNTEELIQCISKPGNGQPFTAEDIISLRKTQ